MLQDQDRIFTNLYGQDDWRLAGARRRGVVEGIARDAVAGRRIETQDLAVVRIDEL